MNKPTAIQFHRDTAECWRAKGRPHLARAHEDRATMIEVQDAPLTELEQDGSAWEIWGEIARTVRL